LTKILFSATATHSTTAPPSTSTTFTTYYWHNNNSSKITRKYAPNNSTHFKQLE